MLTFSDILTGKGYHSGRNAASQVIFILIIYEGSNSIKNINMLIVEKKVNLPKI